MKDSCIRYTYIFLILTLAGCGQNGGLVVTTPKSEMADVQVLEGKYYTDELITNFEDAKISSFVPDGMKNVEPGAGKGYWLIPNDEFVRLYSEEVNAMWGAIATTYGPCDVLAIHVKFEGVLSPPAIDGAGYGYGGLYEHEVKVTRVFEIKYFWVEYSCPPTLSASMTQTAAPAPTPTVTIVP